jgi:hypothetical protein
VVYNANFRLIATGDSLPARFLPFAIWEEGSLHLDSVFEATNRGSRTYWMVPSRDGRVASAYPIVTPLLVTPLYAPAVAFLHLAGRTEERLARVGELMEKLAASVVASLTTGLLYLLLRRRLDTRDATLLAVAFAFGTNVWVTSSQALWQHGATQLFAVVALLALTSTPSWPVALAGGAAIGLIPANRPPDLAMAVGLGASAVLWSWRRPTLLTACVAAAAVPCLLTLGYNQWMFGNVSGGYGVLGVADESFFSGSLWLGVAGLLISPGKGLLLWSPFFFFLPWALYRVTHDRSDRGLASCLALGCVLQLLLYAKTDWRAGHSYGPRFLSDTLPLLIWLLVPILPALRRPTRLLFTGAVGFAICVQAVGAVKYQGFSDAVLYAAPENVWSFEKTPYIVEAGEPFVRMRFLGTVFGVEEAKTYPAYWWRQLSERNPQAP